MKNNQQPVIGLEVHIELKTRSKMFCSCANDSEERHPNTNVCPICLGHPGVLPVINKEAVKKVIKTGLALGCKIPESSRFDRKNYFYPDLPKGYQISQYDAPLCKDGYLEVRPPDITLISGGRTSKNSRKIRIRRVHLEEDTGRLVHPEGADYSLVDFNRAGVPLMELVTEPDINSAKGAREFAEELQLIFRHLGVSDADMEKGQMRVEVNVSLRGGPKVEIKNLNSFRAVEKAIDYEIERQKREKVIQETRGWDDAKGITVSQRTKEEAHDYRYFPEPDLPPLRFTDEELAKIKSEIPELPGQRRVRFKKDFGLNGKSIEVFVQNKYMGNYFEEVAKGLSPGALKSAADFLINTEARNYHIPVSHFVQLINLIKDKKISATAAKDILAQIVDKDPSEIIKKMGLEQISGRIELEKIVQEVIAKNPKPVEDFKKGKENALQYLVGQVMAASQGKANPEITRQLLLTNLK